MPWVRVAARMRWYEFRTSKRATLFYAYRADCFSGGYGPYEPMAMLVEHIRRLSGGWVTRRARPDSAPTAERQMVRASATIGEFDDSWEYSDDQLYRWWYERRWAPGPTMCFVGLNPATGDTDGKPRLTLNKVVASGHLGDAVAPLTSECRGLHRANDDECRYCT